MTLDARSLLSRRRNLSYGVSDGFSAGRVDFAGSALLLAGAGFPTVKYLRIFSRRFGPSPRMASKSSTLLNAPYDLRILQNLFRRCRSDPRNLLQFFSCRGVDVYRPGRRLFLAAGYRRCTDQAEEKKEEREPK
jgi:hypothetical protein